MSSNPLTPSVLWNEVFANDAGAVYQSDQESCWYINFAGKIARFDYRNILKLKKAVYQINIEALLLNTSKAADLEVIFICACDHCYVLSILEIIALKDLLAGTFVMLELNHILEDRLKRVIVQGS
jgi:hypothetical protein